MIDMSVAQKTIDKYPHEPQQLISVMQDLQLEYRYLPREALELTAKSLGVPLAKIYGVATFYKAFSLVPKGRKVLRVCTGTACHIRGAPLILTELKTRLGISPNETTADMEYSLEAVNCVGACALAPVVVENDKAHGGVTVTKARKLVKNRPTNDVAEPAAEALPAVVALPAATLPGPAPASTPASKKPVVGVEKALGRRPRTAKKVAAKTARSSTKAKTRGKKR